MPITARPVLTSMRTFCITAATVSGICSAICDRNGKANDGDRCATQVGAYTASTFSHCPVFHSKFLSKHTYCSTHHVHRDLQPQQIRGVPPSRGVDLTQAGAAAAPQPRHEERSLHALPQHTHKPRHPALELLGDVNLDQMQNAPWYDHHPVEEPTECTTHRQRYTQNSSYYSRILSKRNICTITYV